MFLRLDHSAQAMATLAWMQRDMDEIANSRAISLRNKRLGHMPLALEDYSEIGADSE